MEIKLIAIDMDGTLLQNDHKTVSPRNRDAILKAMQKGIQVVPASGRMSTFLPEQLLRLPGIRYAITSNGAAVVDLKTKEKIFTNHIPNDLVLKVLELVPAERTLCEIYIDGNSYTDQSYQDRIAAHKLPKQYDIFLLRKRTVVKNLAEFVRDTQPGVEKINLPYQEEPLHTELWKQLEAIGGVTLVSSLPCNIEVNAQSANKGAALERLCAHLGIPRSQAMAIGDSGNDMEMLKTAGFAVAMENAEDRVKKLANAVTGSNMEDGVADAIEKYAL